MQGVSLGERWKGSHEVVNAARGAPITQRKMKKVAIFSRAKNQCDSSKCEDSYIPSKDTGRSGGSEKIVSCKWNDREEQRVQVFASPRDKIEIKSSYLDLRVYESQLFCAISLYF